MQRNSLTPTEFPEEFRSLLLDLSINYLMEQPTDIIDFAIEYLMKIKNAHTKRVLCQITSVESVMSGAEGDLVVMSASRRKSVFTESYDPEADDDGECHKVYPKTEEQRKVLTANVKHVLIFRNLEPAQVWTVIDAMFEKQVYAGETVMRQGDDGDYFYVVETGVYEAYVYANGEQKLVKVYDNTGSFGELALMYNTPRGATIKAVTDGVLWAVDRQTFQRIILKSAYKRRKMHECLIECVPMLKALTPYERLNLADALETRYYSNGDQIIKQGEKGDGMYFVEEGTVHIMMAGDDGIEVEIRRLRKGEYFGELALVTHRPRAASAYARGEVKLAFLDVEAFERLLGPCMEIMKRNSEDYDAQILRIFGHKSNMTDLRK